MDTKTRLLCIAHAGEDFDKPQRVQVDALAGYSHEAWTLPKFREILDDIPAEYQETAMVEFDRDNHEGGTGVYYWRDETAEEVAGRVARLVEYVGRERADK